MAPSRRTCRTVVEGFVTGGTCLRVSTHSGDRSDDLLFFHPNQPIQDSCFQLLTDRTLVKELSILLADDNEFFREQATSFLDRLAYVGEVTSADNGQETVRLAGNVSPDVILLDLSMPVKTGFEILPELVRLLPNTPVIVVSSLIGDPYGDEVKRLGAVAVVPKERFVTDIPPLLEEIMESRGS